MTFLVWFMSALATYRITLMISRELGPFEVFKRLRSINLFSKLLKCPYCVSVYVGILVCLCLYLAGYVMPCAMWIILALSLSTVTVIADRTFTSDFQT